MKFFIFLYIVFLFVATTFPGTPVHKKFYSTKKVVYQLSKKYLLQAANEARLHNEPYQRALLYSTNPVFQSKFDAYDIHILNSSNNMAMIQYRSSLQPYLYALDDVTHIRTSLPAYPTLDTTRILCGINEAHNTITPRYAYGPYRGNNVLIGIIDTEFDTRHPAFLDSNNTTRFVSVWDQNDSANSKDNRFGYGVIKNKNELSIDTAFGTKGSFHGTLMAAAAIGSDMKSKYYGVAPEALIAGVCYDYTHDMSLINAIEWLFSLADSLDVPCVISMSIGVSAGPHDGTSELDTYIDKVSGPGRIIVGAAGNDGVSHAHVLFDLKANSTPSGTWITPLQNVSEKDTFYTWRIDLWGEAQKQFMLSTQIYNTSTDELHEETDFITVGLKRSTFKPDTVVLNNDTIIWYINTERSTLNTKPHAEVLAVGKKSIYRAGVRLKSSTTTKVHGWNMHKKSCESSGMENYINGDNNYTINEVGGTAKRIIAAGSYFGRIAIKLWNGELFPAAETDTVLHLAGFSGRGPTVDGRTKPDITAPGVKVVSAISSHHKDSSRTVYWPYHPNLYGRYGPATGTSISAPIVAGTIALLLQADSQLTPEKIKSAFQASAIKDDITGPLTLPDNNWGSGKLNAIGALDYVLGLPDDTRIHMLSRYSDAIRIMVKNDHILLNNVPTGAQLEMVDLHGRVIQRSAGNVGQIKRPGMSGQFIIVCKVNGQVNSSIKCVLTR
ncbi:MAG TPA: S8 family serine peptidase [Chitinispirillaceae bacterium]|nr:S8 family serine peptidase [Chitinispirillaceae bacterium]